MSIRDTINDLEAQRERIDRALSPLYELVGDEVSRPTIRNPTPKPKAAATTKRNISPEVSAERSKRMKEAWERRRAAAAEPAPQFTTEPVNPYSEELANAASAGEAVPVETPAESLASTIEAEHEVPVVSPPVRGIGRKKVN